MGKNEFFKLLMAQLQYQDPLNPMDNTEFIAQLAQFSTLEKMQSLDNNLALLMELEHFGQASGLIGKEIEGISIDGDELISGTVTSAQVLDDGTILSVGEKLVKLSDVLSVAKNEDTQLAQASNLIKMEVEALVPETGETVSGIVDGVEMKDGDIVLKINDRTVKLRDVISITEGDREL
ncbi:MAG: flagellar hook assembly protein FlgD [Chloroflexota bacterium]